MNSLPIFSRHARYNSWRNRAVYQQSALLSEAQRRQNFAVPFGSLHGLLNHNLAADYIWMARFCGEISEISRLDAEIERDFENLRARRFELDLQIENYIANLQESELDAPLRWKLITRPVEMEQPLWMPLTHFFNHQTHHRGQITAVLEMLGVDCGVTDMLALELEN